jgi:hypothetical protein
MRNSSRRAAIGASANVSDGEREGQDTERKTPDPAKDPSDPSPESVPSEDEVSEKLPGVPDEDDSEDQ